MTHRCLFAVCTFLLVIGASLHAEPPHVSYIFPAGGQRGTKIEFRIGGHYLHEKCPLEMNGPGVTASQEIRLADDTIWFEGPLIYFPASSQKEDYPKDYLGEVQIAADAPLGARYWRVSTSQGVTPAMRFVVGDLPEVVEDEIDGEPIPTPIELPVTINGRIFPREDVDVWTFDAPAGKSITCAVVAAGIGSPLDARLEIRGPDGETIAESTGEFGPDPMIRIATPCAGRYEIRIHDINFAGLQHYVYRLTVTDGPWIDAVYPLGGRRESEVKFVATGQQLPAEIPLQIAADAAATARTDFRVNGSSVGQVALAVDDLPEVLETEPNDGPEQAALVSAPTVVNGRIGKPGDVDCWSFAATKDQSLELEITAAQLGSPLDSVLAVLDETGKQVAQNDDAQGGDPDARLSFKAPADGRYVVRLSERFASRGGPAFAYRLRIAEPQADFQVQLASDVLNIDRGASQNLQVNVTRSGGFAEPITLSVEGLPDGVKAADVEVKGNQPQAKANIKIEIEQTARVGLSKLRIIGRSKQGETPLERTAGFRLGFGEPMMDHLTLAVTEPTPFKFSASYEFSFVPRGGTHYKKFTIDRGGYEGPLEVSLADRQIRHLQGVTGSTITVPAGATEFEYPVQLAPWMELGRTSRTVLMLTGVVKDDEGREHKVCFSSGNQNDQIIIRVSPALLRPTLQQRSVAVQPDSAIQIPVEVRRDPSLKSDVVLEAVIPPHVQDVVAEPVVVTAEQTDATLTIRFGARPGPFNLPIVIRAKSRVGDDPVVGETHLELVNVD